MQYLVEKLKLANPKNIIYNISNQLLGGIVVGAYGSPDLNNEVLKKPKKPFYKKWWFIVIVVIVVIAAFGGGGEDTPKIADNEASEHQDEAKEVNAEPAEPVQEFFKLGDIVQTKKVNATITNIEKSNGSQFNSPAEGNEFVLLNIEIENISNSEINVSSMLSFDAYVDDVALNESLSAQIAKEGTNTVDGTLASGKKLKGTLAYEIPTGWVQIEIHFTPDVWDDTAIKWIVENE